MDTEEEKHSFLSKSKWNRGSVTRRASGKKGEELIEDLLSSEVRK